jgi:hypothetical protein
METHSKSLDRNSTNKLDQYPVLVAQQGPLEGRRWNISSDLTIGRAMECVIQIDDRQVSRIHARVTLRKLSIDLEDLESKNGTFVQGKPITGKVTLEDGEVFQIALVQKFVFYTTDATVPLEDMPALDLKKAQGLLLDKKSRRVWIGAKELMPPLSAPQFRLLEALYAQPGLVVSREHLIDFVWSQAQSEGVSEQALDALIRRLRDRLAEIDPEHEYIVTVRGHGLRLENK